ncbi:protein NBR1 homolog isoform X2 [Amborella trichopoda]|uniref:protein NBR1 homolog isoform X2 n=1 Tax=Amborella trichopoda TaxID=13333 RepID=UPI0005D2EBE1|nr:protein NBR1 homolog isoform X2 [Amborella trichopoda]|eukprot:XP_011626187.1 protein NBR1 homolog isoform X2 [Amborella trichopoda]
MADDLVIKVKYGSTLRRFSIWAVGNGTSGFNMDMLKDKIRKLFNLKPIEDFAITYIDEDDDVVTLADDDDLSDAIRQHLDPLRLTVSLTETPWESSLPEASKPTTSPTPGAHSSPDIQALLEMTLKTVPDRVRKSLLTFSNDLHSKFGASKVEEFANFLKALELVDAVYTPPGNGASTPVNPVPPQVSEPFGKTSPGPKSTPQSETTRKIKATSQEKYTESTPQAGANVLKALEKLSEFPVQSKARSPEKHDSTLQEKTQGYEKHDGLGETSSAGPSASQPILNTCFNPIQTPQTPPCFFPPDNFADLPNPKFREMSDSSFIDTGKKKGDSFEVRSIPHVFSRFDGSSLPSIDMPQSIHNGIICDGCGVHPIIGTRKQITTHWSLPNFVKKDNYDLCHDCYEEMGKAGEYMRLDRPISMYLPRFSPHHHHRLFGKSKLIGPLKLNSTFVKDVTIPDGMIVAPNTLFTKIWRLRNSGNSPWRYNTQLVFTSGDPLGFTRTSKLEIPVEGVPIGREWDVSLQLRAPKTPGIYRSYWQLASPSSVRFGQSLWVSIRVLGDPTPEDNTVYGDLLNLNMPPPVEVSSNKGKQVEEKEKIETIDMSSETLTESDSLLNNKVNEAIEELLSAKIPEPEHVAPKAPMTPTLPSVTYPTIDLSRAEVPTAFVEVPIIPTGEVAAAGTPSSKEVEAALLRELEEMGFDEVELNKAVLRRNDYDLEESIDELCCGSSEWDTILDELQEMGFCDEKTNMMLLRKNGGSIKRVVMDLLTQEKNK